VGLQQALLIEQSLRQELVMLGQLLKIGGG